MFSVGDICSCGDSGDYRGHPGRCDSYVLCLAADNIMYPWGRACPDGQCRNSLTGVCSTGCSDAVCNEGVPAGKLDVLCPVHTVFRSINRTSVENITQMHKKGKHSPLIFMKKTQ